MYTIYHWNIMFNSTLQLFLSLNKWVLEWLLFNAKFYSYIKARTSYILWDYDDVHLVLCLAEKQQITIFLSLAWPQPMIYWPQPMIYRSKGDHINHYTTDAVMIFKWNTILTENITKIRSIFSTGLYFKLYWSRGPLWPWSYGSWI